MALVDRYTRPKPPLAADEREMLIAFLDYLRETIVLKCMELSEEDAREPHIPSGMSLLAIIKHLTGVERQWFQRIFLDEDLDPIYGPRDRHAEWIVLENESAGELCSAYRETCRWSNEIIRAHSLDETIRSTARPDRVGMQLRWIVVHMIEETARHAGHMDLIREAIDGEIGE